MNQSKELTNILNKIFSNRNFMGNLINNEENIEQGLSIVLKYYIATRDTNTNYDYAQIRDMYEIISQKFLSTELDLKSTFSSDKSAKTLTLQQCAAMKLEGIIEQFRINIIDKGFLTHSFNGNKKELIQKYGLGYSSEKLTAEEKKQIARRRKSLLSLEKILGTSSFLESQKNNKCYSDIIYLTVPGGKTIHYSLSNSPERLYARCNW